MVFRDSKIGFEEIVKRSGFSRMTVNKYLNELCTEKLVEQEQVRGARPYHLSEKGKACVGKLLFRVRADMLKTKSPEEIKSAFEELSRLMTVALTKYPNDLEAFFSCYAETSDKAKLSKAFTWSQDKTKGPRIDELRKRNV